MAWTAPKTWVPGEMATAALLNTHVRDNLLALDQHTHTGAAGNGDDVITGMDSITMDDQAGDPAVAGRVQRNGTNQRWYNGTAASSIGNSGNHTTH